MEQFVELFSNVANFTWQQLLMIAIGATLIYLAIKKEMEPTLLLPMGFGAILVNLPFVNTEAIETLFNAGIATELFPLLLFIGIGAMIDFGPLLSNPKMFLFGAAAQFGIFFTFIMARLIGFTLQDAGSIAIIGAADGPTSHLPLPTILSPNYQGPIMVAAYSVHGARADYPAARNQGAHHARRNAASACRTSPSAVSGTTRVLFPIFVTVVAGTIAPKSAELIGFLMFGNLIRECGVLGSLSETAQNVPCQSCYAAAWHIRCVQDEGRAFRNGGNACNNRARPCRVHIRYRGRRAVCQVPQPVPQEQGEPHDWRGGHIRLPDGQPCCA